MPDTPQPVARPVHPAEMERGISIREFEQRIAALEQQHNQRVAYVKELSEVRAAALEKALELQAEMNEKALRLQAVEYERRLGELNHAHSEAAKNWARSLPREIFEQYEKAKAVWKTEIEQKVLILQQDGKDLSALLSDVAELKAKNDQVSGGLTLAKSMGAAGLLALAIALLRLAGVVK